MMTQSRAESTWEINNYGRYIYQFPPNTIKSIRQYEKINKKYVDRIIYIYIYILDTAILITVKIINIIIIINH